MTTDDDIVITNSRNFSEETEGKDFTKEGDDLSRRVLEEQGIFIDQIDEQSATPDTPLEFPKKFEDLSGIEIIMRNEDNTEL